MSLPLDIQELGRRLWCRVEKTPNGCWLFLGSRSRDGYGRISFHHRPMEAHRAALLVTGVIIPVGLVVRHSCDTPACCNPLHLSVGTHADNISDRDERGRQAKGEKNGRSKLTVEIVQQILASEQSESSASVSRRLGAHVALVRDIRKRKTWRHVAIPEAQP